MTRFTCPRLPGESVTMGLCSRSLLTVLHGSLGPFQSFGFPRFLGGHLLVSLIQIRAQDMRANHRLDEPADSPSADDRVKAAVDVLIQRNGKFFLHSTSNTCSIRI